MMDKFRSEARNTDAGAESEGVARAELNERLAAASESIASEAHPERNEDAVVNRPDLGLFAVFDGMGGHTAGERASAVAARSIVGGLEGIAPNQFAPHVTSQGWDVLLRSCMRDARKILQSLQSEYEGAQRPPDTTALVAKVFEREGEYFVATASVGNSRAYLFQADRGELEQLTNDDDLVRRHPGSALSPDAQREIRDLLDSVDDPNVLEKMTLSGQRLRWFHERRNILTNSLANFDPASPDDLQVEITRAEPGDTLLLATDGLDNLTTEEIKGIMKSAVSPRDAVTALTGAAHERAKSSHIRAHQDDITALAVRIG